MNETRKYQYCTASEATSWSKWNICGVSRGLADLLETNEEVIVKPKDSHSFGGKVYKYRIAPPSQKRLVVRDDMGAIVNEVEVPTNTPVRTLAIEAYLPYSGWTEIRIEDPGSRQFQVQIEDRIPDENY